MVTRGARVRLVAPGREPPRARQRSPGSASHRPRPRRSAPRPAPRRHALRRVGAAADSATRVQFSRVGLVERRRCPGCRSARTVGSRRAVDVLTAAPGPRPCTALAADRRCARRTSQLRLAQGEAQQAHMLAKVVGHTPPRSGSAAPSPGPGVAERRGVHRNHAHLDGAPQLDILRALVTVFRVGAPPISCAVCSRLVYLLRLHVAQRGQDAPPEVARSPASCSRAAAFCGQYTSSTGSPA